MSVWLNTAFYGFDNLIFNSMHGLAKAAGGFFTPFFTFITFFGEKGLFFIVLSVILLLFKNTRRTGLTMLVAIGLGALMTNVIIKNAVARPRPYAASEEYFSFNQLVGGRRESEFSFPSGHVTVTMTAMTALFFSASKKWSWVGFIFTFLMGLSRIYLVVHYATDVVGAIIVGLIAGVIAFYIVKGVYKILQKNTEKGFCKFMLTADLIKAIKKEK